MSSSMIEVEMANATRVQVTSNQLVVDLDDGRSISLPTSWYPRLLNGTHDERNNYQLIGNGEGIHWPDLDEDLLVQDLIAGRRSYESQKSLDRWLKNRVQQPAS